jgi:uncharacterized SAM-binding protein YcdF (DUF218 family)
MKKKFSVILLLTCLWLIGFGMFIMHIPQKSQKIPTADAVVILTGGSGRVLEGLSILSQNIAKKMLITGVAKKTNISEILLLIKGLSKANKQDLAQNITLGYQATNTVGNAKEATDWMKKNNFNSLILVTSNYHMPRSLLEFKALMPEIRIEISPVEHYNINTLSWWGIFEYIKLLFIEYNKYLACSISLYKNRI